MAKLKFDLAEDRRYETGVNECVLFVKGTDGNYATGVEWNGITAITESPEGAEANALYADNIKYLNLVSAEDLNGTIEAYTYPDAFAECDGSKTPTGVSGVYLGQQERKSFAICYKTKYSDANNGDYYKLHIIYNCLAAPSERAYNTINDSPEAITFSWEFSTTPETVTTAGFKPTAIVTLDSRAIKDAGKETALDAVIDSLYGTDGAGAGTGTDSTLLTPDQVIAKFA